MTTIRLANHHSLPFSGWLRTTTDDESLPMHLVGDGWETVIGRRIGLNTHMLDVRCDLASGEKRTIDLSTGEVESDVTPALPADVLAHFGGWLLLDDVPMRAVSLRQDGIGWLLHLRGHAQFCAEFVADVWVWWSPRQPFIARGEALVTARGIGDDVVPRLIESMRLTWGDGKVQMLGGADGELLADETRLADAQARCVPFVVTWPRHFQSVADACTAQVLRDWQIGAVGVQQLLHDGNPTHPAGATPDAFIGKFSRAVAGLRSWDHPVCGPSIRSSDTGAQEDQTFVRWEPMHERGAGAELVAWLAAIKLHAERPCNHVEADGSPLDPAQHVNPRLLFWDGRVHPSAAVSPDRMHLSRALTEIDSRGRWGPDVEHLLANTLAAACRLTGSPVAQRLLRNLTTVYLLQRTEPPSWSTSTEGNWTRALGWEGIFVVHVWRDLEDRERAQQVVDRWRRRCSTLILPRLAAAERDIWDVRTEPSASLPIVPGWMPWQEAIAAYGLDLACRVVGPSEGSAVALRGALRVVEDAWVREGDRWVEYERLSLAGDRSRSGYFAAAWLPTALAVVLRHDPAHEKARSVWQQIVADTGGGGPWLPPGVPA